MSKIHQSLPDSKQNFLFDEIYVTVTTSNEFMSISDFILIFDENGV